MTNLTSMNFGRVELTEPARALIVQALADAANYRLDGAETGEGGIDNCNDCADDPDGFCDDHQGDHDKAQAYLNLRQELHREHDE